MEILWFEQGSRNVPCGDDWLSERELAVFKKLRISKRRDDWRLGRWTAKRAVASALCMSHDLASLRRIVIGVAATGEPEVEIAGWDERVTISISHRQGLSACAVASGVVALGCDLESVEPKTASFVDDYFTPAEQDWIAQAPASAVALSASLLWSAKESALKALHVGLRADTRSVEVDTACLHATVHKDIEWHALAVRSEGGDRFCGWWCCSQEVVRTVVSNPPPFRMIWIE